MRAAPGQSGSVAAGRGSTGALQHLSPSMHMKSVLTEHGGFHVLVEMDTYFVALTPTTMDTGVAFSVRAAAPSAPSPTWAPLGRA